MLSHTTKRSHRPNTLLPEEGGVGSWRRPGEEARGGGQGRRPGEELVLSALQQQEVILAGAAVAFTFAAFCYMLTLVLCAALIFFVIWQIIAFDELGTDFKNPIDQGNPVRARERILNIERICSLLRKLVVPEYSIHGLFCLMFMCAGEWVTLGLNIPLLFYHLWSVMNADILNYCQKEAWSKLAFYLLSFFYYLYRCSTAARAPSIPAGDHCTASLPHTPGITLPTELLPQVITAPPHEPVIYPSDTAHPSRAPPTRDHCPPLRGPLLPQVTTAPEPPPTPGDHCEPLLPQSPLLPQVTTAPPPSRAPSYPVITASRAPSYQVITAPPPPEPPPTPGDHCSVRGSGSNKGLSANPGLRLVTAR
ncbi:unnamed protein product [Arctogadus glacialis]